MGLISRVSSRTYRFKTQKTTKNKKKMASRTYPLVQKCDMPEEMRVEAQELCVTAVEKFQNNNEGAAKFIKEEMDKKFGAGWHIVIGESYDFQMEHELKSLLYAYVGGNTGVLVWKCS